MPLTQVLLVDNGSLAPAATWRLREIAVALTKRIACPVNPVSLLHSSGVPADQLGGKPAEILVPALTRRLDLGEHDFLVVPLFFGWSGALKDYLPGCVAQLQQRFPALQVRLAAPLFAETDARLARILADNVRAVTLRGLPAPVRVALVDHGSPVRAVTAVRDRLAAQLAGLLGPEYFVAPASMERREGADFDFSGPLLSSLLQGPGWNSGEVIVTRQFLLPGRHAGPGGEVERICRAAEAASGTLQTRPTALVGEHPLLIEILADRWRDGATSRPLGSGH